MTETSVFVLFLLNLEVNMTHDSFHAHDHMHIHGIVARPGFASFFPIITIFGRMRPKLSKRGFGDTWLGSRGDQPVGDFF